MAAPASKPITRFDEGMTLPKAEEWFANAQNRLLQWNMDASGDVPKRTLIELIRTVLTEIIGKSYYKKGEFAEWNAANIINNRAMNDLSTQMSTIQKELTKKNNLKKGLETLGKPVPADLIAEISSLSSRYLNAQSSLLGANGPTSRIQNRTTMRLKTLKNRQDSFVRLVKAYIESSALFNSAQKTEANYFLDGLIPYFKKMNTVVNANGNVRYTLINSNNDYRGAVHGFDAQFRELPTSGSREVLEGLAKLNANTHAAAAAVSRVPGMEGFNSLTNDILLNPIAEATDEDVIGLIASMTPAMLDRMEERARDEAKRQALVKRLKALRHEVVPNKPGDVGFDQFADLVQRLKRLRGEGGAGGAGKGPSGSAGGARRRRRTMRRSRR
jgi:hypothetical protein